MVTLTRRDFVAGTAAFACAGASLAGSAHAALSKFDKIESSANTAIQYMLENVPHSEDLISSSVGMLIMPLVTKAAAFFGGAYGEGVLRIDGHTEGYYNSFQLNYGLQFSAHQYSSVLFFLNQHSLEKFLGSNGWKFGAEMKGLVLHETEIRRVDTLTRRVDVVGVVFGASGVHLGVSLEGTKYTRIDA